MTQLASGPVRVAMRLRAFRARDDRDGARRFLAGHTEALERHRRTGLTSLDAEWLDDPGTYVVALESVETGECQAGMRLQVAQDGRELPTQKAFPNEALRTYVRERIPLGIGEVCGAWISHTLGRANVFGLLSSATLAIAPWAGVRVIFLSCGEHTRPVIHAFGARLETNLGEGGTFFYASSGDPVSYLMVHPDTHGCETTLPGHREGVFHMRREPRTRLNHTSPRLVLDVDVDLRAAVPSP